MFHLTFMDAPTDWLISSELPGTSDRIPCRTYICFQEIKFQSSIQFMCRKALKDPVLGDLRAGCKHTVVSPVALQAAPGEILADV